jgi:hypothetical protein
MSGGKEIATVYYLDSSEGKRITWKRKIITLDSEGDASMLKKLAALANQALQRQPGRIEDDYEEIRVSAEHTGFVIVLGTE